MAIIWSALAFLCGAIPFSVWIGRYALGKDITQYGDKNPGATNVMRAGGRGWYAFALFLDVMKGIIPVGTANYVFGIDGWTLAAIGVMPPLGHAFSPFLGGNGGKAVAAAAGVWFGLGMPYFVTAIVGIIAWSLVVKPSGYAVVGTMGLILVAIWLTSAETAIYLIWLSQFILFLWKHREDLGRSPTLFFTDRNKQS